MKNILNFILSFLIFESAYALEYSDFFKSNEIQNFQLKAPFSKMSELKKTNNFLEIKSKKFEGTISYKQINDIVVSLPVIISIKGFSSIFSCTFPKLELKFKKAEGTIFENVKKIDLNTHCNDDSDLNSVVKLNMNQTALRAHREVVAYKILETLGIKSFSTKSIFMSYLDSELNTKPEGALKNSEYEAFFIEDKSQFLSENAFSEIKGINDVFKSFDLANQKTLPEQYQFQSIEDNINYLDRYELATIELFENTILNADWFIKLNPLDLRIAGDTKDKNEVWNVKIFEKSNKNWIVVPQDFNLSFLCRIENLPEMINLPVDRKIFDTLELDKKELLLKTLASKKSDILALANLIANDPKHDRIVSFLENRINFIIKELSK